MRTLILERKKVLKLLGFMQIVQFLLKCSHQPYPISGKSIILLTVTRLPSILPFTHTALITGKQRTITTGAGQRELQQPLLPRKQEQKETQPTNNYLTDRTARSRAIWPALGDLAPEPLSLNFGLFGAALAREGQRFLALN